MTRNRFSPGWDDKKTRRVLAHYENQSAEQAAAEDERVFARRRRTVIEVPSELVPLIRGMLELLPPVEASAQPQAKTKNSRRNRPVEAQ
jgi:hypothetical protein